MTPRIDLEAIRARVEAATAGPWHEYDVRVLVMSEPNARFAAEARTDIHALLGLVEEMRGELLALEWSGATFEGDGVTLIQACPHCSAPQRTRLHAQECPLKAAIDATARRKDGAE